MDIDHDFLEVKFEEPDNFLKIKEKLKRIGVASRRDNKLFQSCHILHKQGKYYIVHFKELFLLDGKDTDISDNDITRRNSIARLLSEWGLMEILTPVNEYAPMNQIKVISYKDKENWELVPKYNLGGKSS
jgi:hypothetical protein